MTESDSNFLPTASLDRLKLRADVIKCIRRFFDERDFLEVETQLLSHDTVVDRCLHPIPVRKQHVIGSTSDATMWLQTSPEFAMKRLLSAGASKIYQICKAFRRDERGRLHNPEFTMLEWYRVGDDLSAGMDLLATLVETILQRPATKRLTYQQVFQQETGIDVHTDDNKLLLEACREHGLDTSACYSETERDTCLNLLLTVVIEPALAKTPEPKMIFDWPASQSALAKIRLLPDGTKVAERFEIYVDGIELANGYHELLDADELLRRNRAINKLRIADGEEALPEHSRLLSAMKHGLPACAGAALGIDRLVMLAAGAGSIAEVMAFPMDRV